MKKYYYLKEYYNSFGTFGGEEYLIGKERFDTLSQAKEEMKNRYSEWLNEKHFGEVTDCVPIRSLIRRPYGGYIDYCYGSQS